MSVFVSGNRLVSVASCASTSLARARVAVTSNSLVSFMAWAPTLVDLDPPRCDQERRPEREDAQQGERLAERLRPAEQRERRLAALERLEDLLRQRLRRRVLDEQHVRVGREPHLLLRREHRLGDAAQTIDEADLYRLRAGPDAAARDLVDGGDVELAALGDAAEEAVVGVLHVVAQHGARLGRERLRREQQIGARAARDRLDPDAELLEQAGDHGPDHEHADRAGERLGLTHDRVGRARHVVAARRRQVGHRRHHRLPLLLDLADGLPDQIRGERRAAGAVEAEHDRLHLGILRGVAQRLGDRVRRHHRAAVREVALAHHHRADAVDDRERRGRREADTLWRHLRVDVLLHLLVRAERRDRVLPGRHVVDQAELDEGLGRARRRVDRELHLLLGALPRGGDLADELAFDRVDQRVRLLAVRRRHLRLGVALDRALVLADALVLDVDAELLEQAAVEEVLGREAHEGRVAARRRDHLVRRAREVVRRIAEALELEHRERALALLAELLDRLADLLRLGPAELERAHAEHHAVEPRVARGLAQLGGERQQRLDLLAAEAREEGHRAVHVAAGQLDHEQRARRDAGRAPAARYPPEEREEQRGRQQPARKLLHGPSWESEWGRRVTNEAHVEA